MKKIFMIFAMMTAVLSSCQKSELESVSTNDGKSIVLNISVSNPGADTKAPVKNAWADGDEISIWYDANTQPTPDLVITYNGIWIQKEGATVSGNAPSEGDNKYAKALYNGTVKVASKDDYTYDGTTLTFKIENWVFLTEVQVVVKGLTSDKASDYTLACDKFTPLADTGDGYTVGSDAITASTGTKGAAVTGISNTDGVAFIFATADYSTSSTDKKDFKFTLKDNTSGSEVTTVYKPNIAIEAKTGKATIKALTIANTKFLPSGATNGEFTVGTGVKVHFSKGNLYAKQESSTWTWGFYDKQYQFNSLSMPEISSSGGSRDAASSDTEIDQFTWGYDNTSTNTSYSLNPVNTAGISGHTSDEKFSDSEDWGSISGLPSAPGANWRTLSKDEWTHLLNNRTTNCKFGSTTNTNARYLKCAVKCDVNSSSKDVYGLMFFPDEFTWPSGAGDAPTVNNKTTAWNSVPVYTTDQFTALEAAGVVFLPAAGSRDGTSVFNVGSRGDYWSSTASTSASAYYLDFYGGGVTQAGNDHRKYGRSVRLVSVVQ